MSLKTNSLQIVKSLKYFGLRKLYYLTISTLTEIKELLTDMRLIRLKFQESPLISRRLARKIIQEYEGDPAHNLNRDSFFLGYALIHYSLIRNIKPHKLLIIGSRKGFIPAIVGLACKDNHRGKVDFVDASYGETEPSKNWSGVNFWNTTDHRKHFAKIGIERLIRIHIMTSQDFATAYPKNTYDYIYIDGDHSYPGVKSDYKLFWKRLTKHGFMLFHDIQSRGYLNEGKFGVEKFWKQLKGNKIFLPFPKESGLGIIQKP